MTETLTQRFADCINHLWRVVAAHQGGGAHPQRMDPAVIDLVYRHLRLVARRFAAICAHVAAGTLRQPPVRTPRAAPTPAKLRPEPRRFPHRLPGIHAWLRTLSNPTYHTNIAAGWFETLFQDPEMQELVKQAPQLRQVLRPLCTMLGIDPPTDPTAPEPPRKPRARPRWTKDPNRTEYPGAILPPLRFKIA